MKYYSKSVHTDYELFHNISAYRLAKLVGVSGSYMQRVRNGDYIISEQQYKRLVKAKNRWLRNA